MTRILVRLGLVFFLFASATFAGTPSDKADTQPQVNWIRANAIPLRTVEAGNGFDDLQPLKKVIGEARIVALGEATHGSREFFQLKHRMIEFLATQMGFTIFSIEANMPEAYRLNEYVLHGTGDPKALLKGMYFWTWQTEEVLAMVEWMREFNRSGKGHIEFTGFDMQTPTVAMDVVRQYVAEHDASYLATLDPVWAEVKKLSSNGSGFGVGTATFPVAAAAGKTVTFSGYIKTENITRGYAGLWWRIDGEKGANGMPEPLGFDNMGDRGPHGTTPWTRYEIKLKVPANARNINFGVLHPGNGTAWFDSLQVELDGVPYADSSNFDLDFESETPRGFYAGGQGYKVGIDNQVAHSGKQSLRSTSLAEQQTDEVPRNAALAVAACRSIVRDLEERRAGVSAEAAKSKELEWAVQNARVVLQFAQLQAHQRSRDESMADNIKWIAEQNPGAKIVLWAHNGHVAYGGTAAYGPMGSYLHRMFGTRLVNFGFAFNQGSFQAVEMGKGLHDFTVGPAPDGSLDQVLASAGLPVMALDLRTAPKQGPAADWIRAHHATRSIGAVFSNDSAKQYLMEADAPEMFDVLLFVEKTTAARRIAPPNPATEAK